MALTIFFSWQADTPNPCGRNIIERALERAIGSVGQDLEIEEAVRDLELDRDTKNVSGFPPIVDTIFKKIDCAAIFVPDLTFVGERLDGRPSPNPNVLIEYGWALKSLSYARIVPVMNSAFGLPTAETMPFDMAHLRRPILYDCPEGADEGHRKKVRDDLTKQLEGAIRAVLTGPTADEILPKKLEAPAFECRSPIDGKGRFKAISEPIGVRDDRFRTEEVTLSGEPAVWFRMFPSRKPERTWSNTELEAIARRPTCSLAPVSRGWAGFDYIRNHEGTGTYAALDDRDTARGVIFVFKTGELWSVDTVWLQNREVHNVIPFVEPDFRNTLVRYGEFLSALGVDPPYRWIAGMEDLKGRSIYVPPPRGKALLFPGPQGRCQMDVATGEGLYSPGDSPIACLKLFFDNLFDSCGLPRPAYLDEDGT